METMKNRVTTIVEHRAIKRRLYDNLGIWLDDRDPDTVVLTGLIDEMERNNLDCFNILAVAPKQQIRLIAASKRGMDLIQNPTEEAKRLHAIKWKL